MFKPRFHKQMTNHQFETVFPNEDACKTYLQLRRWPNGVHCPYCNNENVYELQTRPYHWQCDNCADDGYRFSLYVGTIFENTNLPLKTWFRAICMMLTSEKGVSALHVHRTIGTDSYDTAWYAYRRVRAGLRDEKFRKLVGIVEADDIFARPDPSRTMSAFDLAERLPGKAVAATRNAADLNPTTADPIDSKKPKSSMAKCGNGKRRTRSTSSPSRASP